MYRSEEVREQAHSQPFLSLTVPAQDEEPAEVIPLDATAVDSRDLEQALYLIGSRREWRFVASVR